MGNVCGLLKRIYCTKAIFWLRYKVRYRRRRVMSGAFVVLLFAVINLLHFIVLPSLSGAYNDDCYLSEKKLNELRHLIIVSAKLMEKHNMTYWLDFGTLLGAVKFGDVIPWDGDADISSIYHKSSKPSSINEEFASFGIHRNALVATVNGTVLDYYRWTINPGVFNGHEDSMLKIYYPNWIMKNENILAKFEHDRQTLPLSWIVPTRKINFHGVQVSVPGEYEKCLEARYPLTYKYNMFTPYKWKCWFPCWLTREKNCRRYSKQSPTLVNGDSGSSLQ